MYKRAHALKHACTHMLNEPWFPETIVPTTAWPAHVCVCATEDVLVCAVLVRAVLLPCYPALLPSCWLARCCPPSCAAGYCPALSCRVWLCLDLSWLVFMLSCCVVLVVVLLWVGESRLLRSPLGLPSGARQLRLVIDTAVPMDSSKRQTDRLKPHRDVGRSDRLAGQTNLNLDSTYAPAANTTNKSRDTGTHPVCNHGRLSV